MKSIIRKISTAVSLLLINIMTFAQQPTHYPKANDPIPWTIGNIIVYIGGPILLFVLYYYYRRWDKKKRLEKKNSREQR